MSDKYTIENIGFFTKRMLMVSVFCGTVYIAGLLGAPIAKILFIGNGIAFGISVFLLIVPELSVWFLNKFNPKSPIKK